MCKKVALLFLCLFWLLSVFVIVFTGCEDDSVAIGGDISANDVNLVFAGTDDINEITIGTSWCLYINFPNMNAAKTALEEYDYIIGIDINDKEYNFTLDELVEKLIPKEPDCDTVYISIGCECGNAIHIEQPITKDDHPLRWACSECDLHYIIYRDDVYIGKYK